MRLWQMKNNKHHSGDQAQHLPLRPDTGGTTGRGGKQLKQNSRCHNLRDIL